MAIYTIKPETLQSIADAIRAVSGKTDTILVSNFASEILALKDLYSMTIDGTTYYFEDGMSWEEWKDSAYNTGGYAMNVSGEITDSTGAYVVINAEGIVQCDIDTIVADAAYTLKENTIVFTIDGTEYQAIDGMTWAEWLDTDYNTSGCYLSDSGVYGPSDNYVTNSSGDILYGTETIIAGEAYSTMATLATPEISLDGTTLNIYDEEGLATSYDILVDGVVMDSVQAVSLISFSIAGESMQAEEGMTWYEWCNSDYNTFSSGLSCSSNTSGVHPGGMGSVYTNSGVGVKGSDAIISTHSYTIQTGTSND